MPRTDDLPDALASLVTLGQVPDVNIRPVLLRVVVDLFVSKDHHAPADIHQFDVLVSLLLDDADAQTRAIVAEKMARHPLTPRRLIDRFLADEVTVAAMAYGKAALDPAALMTTAAWGATPLATAIADRTDLTEALVEALASRPEDEVIRVLVANPTVVLARPIYQQLVRRARGDDTLAAKLIDRPADPIDLAPLFPLADALQRQAIIEAARRLELGRRQWGRVDGVTGETLARLDRMIMSGERENFETALGIALGIDPATLVPLLQDDGGEIMALALSAAGAAPELAARVFILGDPRIGHSIVRVRALTAIVASVSSHAARRLIAAMTATPAETPRRAVQTAGRSAYGSRRAAEQAQDTNGVRREPATAVPTRRLG